MAESASHHLRHTGDGVTGGKCPECTLFISLSQNLLRHRRNQHGVKIETQPGRPKSNKPSDNGAPESTTLATRHNTKQTRQGDKRPNSEKWWQNEPWFRQISGQEYHWNPNILLGKLLELRRLNDDDEEYSFPARFLSPARLPTKSPEDALKSLREHRATIKYYQGGQFHDVTGREAYGGETYDKLLFDLSAPARPNDPRYAKVAISKRDFDFANTITGEGFIHCPQSEELFASPAGSWSDIHIDHFLAGLAMPVGETVKLFACWESTDKNLKLLDSEPPGPGRLLHIVDRLERGFSAVVTKEAPIHLRGCLHAVVTLRGGLMYAGNFMTARNGPSLLRALRLSTALVDSYDDEGRRGLVENILDQVGVTSLDQSCWSALLREWSESYEVVLALGLNASQNRRILKVFQSMLRSRAWQEICSADPDAQSVGEAIVDQLKAFEKKSKVQARRP